MQCGDIYGLCSFIREGDFGSSFRGGAVRLHFCSHPAVSHGFDMEPCLGAYSFQRHSFDRIGYADCQLKSSAFRGYRGRVCDRNDRILRYRGLVHAACQCGEHRQKCAEQYYSIDTGSFHRDTCLGSLSADLYITTLGMWTGLSSSVLECPGA